MKKSKHQIEHIKNIFKEEVGPTRQHVISFLSERQDTKMISSRNMISGVKDGYLIVMAMII